MWVTRDAHPELVRLAKRYPVVALVGPRQSGKSTLCGMAFPDKPYVSLEKIALREFATSDPEGFLDSHAADGAVIDEIQHVPSLLSEIQIRVDASPRRKGMFVLTGSQQFPLMSAVSQSLAGRTAILRLLPFTYGERYGVGAVRPPLGKMLFDGFYPRISTDRLNPTEALSFYVATYVERDVRDLLAVRDLSAFSRFLRLCAGRTGQTLNASALANDAGINHNTARAWLSILEASFIVTLLPAHHRNFNKRLVKSPKLYFWDTGLACCLLGIESPKQLASHPLAGALFETWAVTELMKQRLNRTREPRMSYWRDNVGHEVDILIEGGNGSVPIEVKMGATIRDDQWKGLEYHRTLNPEAAPGILLHGGREVRMRSDGMRAIPYSGVVGLVDALGFE